MFEKIIGFIKSIRSNVKVQNKIANIKENLAIILCKDNEIIQDVVIGYDENLEVFIVMTNRHLYVVGDVVMHKVKKENIICVTSQKGIMAHLVLIETMRKSIYFKTFNAKAVTKIKDWAK